MANIPPQLAIQIIAHQQVDDPLLGLRLKRHLPLGILEQRAEQGGQRQRFGEQGLDNRRVEMIGKDRVDCRTKPNRPPPRMTRRDRHAKRDIEGQIRFRHQITSCIARYCAGRCSQLPKHPQQ